MRQALSGGLDPASKLGHYNIVRQALFEKAQRLVIEEARIGAQQADLGGGGGVISVQNSPAWPGRGREWKEVRRTLAVICESSAEVAPVTLGTHERGLGIRGEAGLPHIRRAAAGGGARSRAACNVFYSEDLQDGQRIEGLVIRNPFAACCPTATLSENRRHARPTNRLLQRRHADDVLTSSPASAVEKDARAQASSTPDAPATIRNERPDRCRIGVLRSFRSLFMGGERRESDFRTILAPTVCLATAKE
jgi:hypothetical protein